MRFVGVGKVSRLDCVKRGVSLRFVKGNGEINGSESGDPGKKDAVLNPLERWELGGDLVLLDRRIPARGSLVQLHSRTSPDVLVSLLLVVVLLLRTFSVPVCSDATVGDNPALLLDDLFKGEKSLVSLFHNSVRVDKLAEGDQSFGRLVMRSTRFDAEGAASVELRTDEADVLGESVGSCGGESVAARIGDLG